MTATTAITTPKSPPSHNAQGFPQTSTLIPNWLTAEVLAGMQRGIEKEGLRMSPTGYIADTPHPKALGSKLTHPFITTDYAESLLGFR